MDNNGFKETGERISNAYFCGVTIAELYSCATLSETHDELDAAIDATIALNDLVDSHYSGGMDDAIADCRAYEKLGALDDDLIADIALENGVDFDELKAELDQEK